LNADNPSPVHRLYPQIPANVRFALRRTILPTGGGPDGNSPVLIRKGTGVGWSTYHMHRMESLYGPDSEEFVPERWENTDLERKVGFGFMPFHGGPRMCLGSECSRPVLSRTFADGLSRGFRAL
jgi:cytochrome P450